MKITKAVIPVAGKGTRFLPATKEIPKEMLPILKRPMIHYIVEEAVTAGIEEIVFVTSSGKQVIEDYFDRNLELEHFLQLRGKEELLAEVKSIGQMASIIAIRQKEQLGLGHAILSAKGALKGENFAVLLGDEILLGNPPPIKQLLEVYTQQKNSSVVGVVEIDKAQSDKYGIVEGNNIPEAKGTLKLQKMVEKPPPAKAPSNLAAPGRYIFTNDIFQALEEISRSPDGEYQLTDAINLLATNSNVYAHTLCSKRYDTGNLEGYLDATLEFALMSDKYSPIMKDLICKKVKKYNL